MKKYILVRILKSIISILAVVSIVVVMTYTLIPRSKIFENDTVYNKLKGNSKTLYAYSRYEEMGYLDYLNIAEMCNTESSDVQTCLINGSAEQTRVLDIYKQKGYQIKHLDYKDELQGGVLAYRDYGTLEIIGRFFSQLIQFDHSNFVQDSNNPSLDRGYYFGGNDGNFGLLCSGCEYKYQIYVNGQFPFIHQNMIHLNFGKSFPTYSGIKTLDIINNGQGSLKPKQQTFPSGMTTNSPIIQSSCRYKPTTDHLDQQRFYDNYADCTLAYNSPSMVQVSYIFGISALFVAYLIALPAGISMARNKGKWQDKVGTVYINLLVAVPSLAFIFFMKYIGTFFGLPDKFPQFGFFDLRSYILPIIILALLGTPGIMMWLRRYMVDQSNADYVKFARSKGLSQREISRNHILKNAIIPIVNGIPASIILTISGAVITESVFAIPGMGKMLPDAIKATNNNMVITLTFIFTTLSVIAILLGDLLMIKVDPRISLNKKKGE